MTVFNLIRAFRRGYQLGEARARREIEQQLREQAALHRGLSGDAHRRKALNSAADAVRDQRAPGRRRTPVTGGAR